MSAAVWEPLVEEPSSVIVDLAGLTAEDDAAAQTFPRLAAQAAHWPGTALRLCNPPVAVASVVQRSATDGAVTVHPDFPAALAAAATAPVPQRMHQRLEPTVHAPRAARELAADACTEWGLPGCLIPAEILASELVTNSVQHAGTVMDLRITLRDRLLRVSVHDRSARRARLRTPTGFDDHGRGLLIVSSIASGWGSEPVIGGKVVWASLQVRRAPPGRLVNPGAVSQETARRDGV